MVSRCLRTEVVLEVEHPRRRAQRLRVLPFAFSIRVRAIPSRHRCRANLE